MDFNTAIGITASILLIAFAISTQGTFSAFVDFPSILIVIGGTFFITIGCFAASDVKKAWRYIWQALANKQLSTINLAKEAVIIAEITRKKSIMELEHEPIIQEYHLIERGVALLNEGNTYEQAEKVLSEEAHSTLLNKYVTIDMLNKAAEISPAMGLIGTLIGLVQMLGSMSDPSKIGPAMAIALLTTFYGAFLAYVILFPLSAKMQRSLQHEEMLQKICLRVVLAISRKENPRILESAINSMLTPDQKLKMQHVG
jgi:chemotaxis protein MotA